MFRRTLLLPAVGVILAGAVAAGCGSSGSSNTSTTTTSAKLAKPVSGPLIGVTFDGPVLYPNVNLSGQLDRAVASGVESLRVAINWAEFQPYRMPSDVPADLRSQFVTAGGVPTRFAGLDRLVALAAQRHLPLLPVLEYTPSWDANASGQRSRSPPKDTAPYAAALTALIDRYGPHGTFWIAHPRSPKCRSGCGRSGTSRHFVAILDRRSRSRPHYVALLRAAHAAIKAADPAPRSCWPAWPTSRGAIWSQIYQSRTRAACSTSSPIHPYTATAPGA